MTVKVDAEVDLLKKHSLFYGLNQDELIQLKSFLRKRIIPSHTTIIEEGEHTTDIYLLAEGEVNVLKWDESRKFKLPILRIGPGEMFGEMSFVDSSPRASSIQATQTAIIYQLSRHDLEINKQSLGDIYNKLLTNIARISMERLRLTNKRISSTFKNSLSDLQARFDSALAVMYFAVAMSFGKLLTFMQLPFFLGSQKLINWGFWIFILMPAMFLIIYFNYSREKLGVTSHKLSKTLFESVLAIGLGIALLYVTKKFLPRPLNFSRLDMTTMSGYFFFCTLYEFLARGFFQSSLEKVFENTLWLPPFATAVAFTLALLTSTQLQWSMISLIFFGNVLLGFFFLRNKNLIGVILIHFVLGLWIIY